MRLVVLTDIHANLPALDAALAAIHQHGYDLLVHTGDAIGIGPFPAECLDRLFELPKARLVMGNHAWFANGLPHPRPDLMSEGNGPCRIAACPTTIPRCLVPLRRGKCPNVP